jgi:hypothetical protein
VYSDAEAGTDACFPRVVAKKKLVRTVPLSAEEDLDLSLRVVGELQRAIGAADTKAGLLLAAVGFALTGLVTASRGGNPATGLRPIDLAALVVLVPLVTCLGYLTSTIRPTLSGGTPSWFSFPAFPVSPGHRVPDRPNAAVLAEQAWLQAATLEKIAQRKHHAVRQAIRWGTGSLLTFIAWFSVATLLTRFS